MNSSKAPRTSEEKQWSEYDSIEKRTEKCTQSIQRECWILKLNL